MSKLEELLVDLTAAVHHLAERTRAHTEQLVARAEGGVLASLTAQLDSSSKWGRSFRQPFRTVRISDPNSIGPLLVSSSDQGSPSASTFGEGSWVLAAGDCRTIALYGTELHVYSLKEGGAAGDVFSVTVLASSIEQVGY